MNPRRPADAKRGHAAQPSYVDSMESMDSTTTQALDVAALEALGEEIVGFAARIDVAEHALLHKL